MSNNNKNNNSNNSNINIKDEIIDKICDDYRELRDGYYAGIKFSKCVIEVERKNVNIYNIYNIYNKETTKPCLDEYLSSLNKYKNKK